jgi:hypothetical protein
LGRPEFLMPRVANARDRARYPLSRGATLGRSRRLRRPLAPSQRAHRVDMGRSAFLTLIGCWAAGLFVLLALALAIRIFG